MAAILNKLLDYKSRLILVAVSSLAFIFSLAYKYSGILIYDSPYSDVLIVVAFFLLLSYLMYRCSYDRRVVSPIGFFIISACIFIISRPAIYLINGSDMVEAGNIGSLYEQISTIYSFLIFFSLIAFFYAILSFSRSTLNNIQIVNDLYFFKNRFISLIALSFSLVILSYFFYRSVLAALIVVSSDYLEIAGTELISSHVKYFFYGKWLIIIYVITSASHKRYLIASTFLFAFSAGFLMIGLRGYFIAYFFLFLYFFNVRFSFNLFYLAVIGFVLLLLSGFAFEYRLGYKVYDGVLDIITKTFHQQGATFEVLHGVVHFTDKVNSCVDVHGYFSSYTDFGRCVDQARGVFWEYGGFATSIFAELYYFNIVVATFIVFLFSAFLRVLDYSSVLFFIRDKSSNVSGFLLLSLIPNLVYIARSDSFDFIFKFFSTSVFLLFVIFLSGVVRLTVRFKN